MGHAERASAGRWPTLDALRAFAVLLVAVSHVGLGKSIPGGSGVTIFFAISGFIITTLLLKEFDQSRAFDVAAFYFRRACKLAPPFIVVVLVPTLVYAAFWPVSWADVLSQVFFYFNWPYMYGGVAVLPGSGVVWSLSIEEQFYIGLSLLWLAALRSRRPMRTLGGITVVAVVAPLALRLYLAATNLSEPRSYYGTDTRLDGIAWGVLAALIVYRATYGDRRAARLRDWCLRDSSFVLAIAVYLVTLVVRDPIFRETARYSLQGIATCVVILYGIQPSGSRLMSTFQSVSTFPVVRIIGLASYSIYLVHLSLITALLPLTSSFPVPVGRATLLTAGVLAGVLVWYSVELPSQAWRRRRTAATHKRQTDHQMRTSV
jgi:peptidoglycan/LPS O-acetylase OafA/YrhL